MNRFTTVVFLAVAIATAPAARAGTIIKLGFGTDSKPDIQLDGGVISTFNDETGATVGDQNTEVTFLGELSGLVAPEGDRASFTLDSVIISGDPMVIGGTVLQPTAGGTFALYDPSNTLLLSGTLGNGTLSGPVSNIATGGFLTTEFGGFTGGSLLSTLTDAGLALSTFSIALTDVNDGGGLSINPDTNQLNDFTADATAAVGGQAPEPSTLILSLLAGLALLPRLRSAR